MLNHWIGKIFGRAIGCPAHEELFDFALDGMESAQQDKVRRHLSACPSCCEQVKDYAWVSEGIALSAPQIDPPQGLCDKVKARIREEGAVAPAPLIMLGRDPLAGWPRFWMRMGPVFALSSLTMTVLAFVAVFHRPLPAADAEMQAAAQIIASPSMHLVSLSGDGQVKGSLFVAPGMGQALVKVQGLKACGEHAAYALWASAKGGKPTRLGSFRAVDGRCAYMLSFPTPFDGALPLDFEVTHEENSPATEKGPASLHGRYNL